MYTLDKLEVNRESRKKIFRRGRGSASGAGKTSGRGEKGQLARNHVKFGFEGGQMPLIRRIPKRGFKNEPFRVRFDCVNLEVLNRFENGAKVDLAFLINEGVISGCENGGLKILADGELTKKLTVVANKFSKKAEEKIKAAGGTVEVI